MVRVCDYSILVYSINKKRFVRRTSIIIIYLFHFFIKYITDIYWFDMNIITKNNIQNLCLTQLTETNSVKTQIEYYCKI